MKMKAKIEENLHLAREPIKKNVEHKDERDTNCR